MLPISKKIAHLVSRFWRFKITYEVLYSVFHTNTKSATCFKCCNYLLELRSIQFTLEKEGKQLNKICAHSYYVGFIGSSSHERRSFRVFRGSV